MTWLDEPVRLRAGVELLRGADDHPLLFVPGRGTYVRLTPAAARLLPLLDGRITGTQLIDRAAAAPRRAGPDRRGAVRALLDALRRAGALAGDAEPPRRAGRGRRRLALPLPADRWARRPAALLRRVPPRLAAGAAALTAALALTLAAAALLAAPAAAPAGAATVALLAAALPLQLLLHEGAHAVACAALGVPVREAGFVLWVVPVGYVDCTDAYRLRGRAPRAAIALAGPFVDLLAAGASAAAWLLTGRSPGAPWQGLLLAQLVVLLTTLAPLLPGDGLHALEALTGEFGIRARARVALAHLLLRRPLPAVLAAVPARRRAGWVAYGVLAAAWTAATVLLAALVMGALT
ncbi:MAG TPA: hypothetical protein VKG45_12295 [Actinomycetes bacterium]|nr:hypothetical protein [Actinomycetes bacterium]